ncbi:MAG: acyl-CoA dehydrogenase family protein [Sciscionella sp.]
MGTESVAEFSARARAWLTENVQTDVGSAATGPDAGKLDLHVQQRYQQALFDAGFAGLTWPVTMGGQGLGMEYQVAWNTVITEFDPPAGAFIIGLGMCGPTLVDLGSEAQQQRYLAPMLRGAEIWCQLFSEPGAGSDVASLQAKAVRTEDGWRLSGQKVWTTAATLAHYGAILARTDPERPKHRGITMFIVDMRAAGVTVRPLRDMSGDARFNEVFFDDVALAPDSVIGEVNAGWQAAVTMLGHERVFIGGSASPRSTPLSADSLIATALRYGTGGDPAVRARLAELHVRQSAASLLNTLIKQQAQAGIATGARGSIGKLVGAENAAFAADIAAQVAGTSAVAWAPDDERAQALAKATNSAPAGAIAGGTNQIQRNILGERVLGLPKEPQVDRDVPFTALKVGTQHGEKAADAPAVD